MDASLLDGVRWCESIHYLTRKPAQVVVALFGDNHGVTDEIATQCQNLVPNIKIVNKGNHVNIGCDRNKAVDELSTEWIMLLSADDIILPQAIEEFEKYDSKDIDVIACSYKQRMSNGDEQIITAPALLTKENIFRWRNCWIAPYSPFRRSFWKKTPYMDHEYS